MYMSTGKVAAKVLAECENTEVDILVGLETGYLNKIHSSLADISGISRISCLEGFSLENNHPHRVTWERHAEAITDNRYDKIPDHVNKKKYTRDLFQRDQTIISIHCITK